MALSRGDTPTTNHLGLAQQYLPMFGRRSILSSCVARPFHTESMRSPRALPDGRLSTQTGEGIVARALNSHAPVPLTIHKIQNFHTDLMGHRPLTLLRLR